MMVLTIHSWVISQESTFQLKEICSSHLLVNFQVFPFQSSWLTTGHENYCSRFFMRHRVLWETGLFWRLVLSKISLIGWSCPCWSPYDIRKTKPKLPWLKKFRLMVLMELKIANSHHCSTIMTKFCGNWTLHRFQIVSNISIYSYISEKNWCF